MKKLIFLVSLQLLLVLGMKMEPAQAQTATATPDCCGVTSIGVAPVATPQSSLTNFGISRQKGLIYVGERFRNVIDIFSTGLVYQKALGAPGEFNGINSVTVGPDDLLYESEDSGAKIQVVDPDTGASLDSLPLPNYGRGLFVDTNGDIYATSLANPIYLFHRLSCAPAYDAGTLLVLNGDPDSSPDIYAVFKDGEDLYVFENFNLNKYLHAGGVTFVFSKQIGAPTGPPEEVLYSPGGMTRDPFGNYYTVSGSDGDILGYDRNFQFVFRCNFGGIGGVLADEQGDTFMNQNNQSMLKLHQTCLPQGVPTPDVDAIPGCTPTPGYTGSNPPGAGQVFVYPSPARAQRATLAYFMAEAGTLTLKIWNHNGELVEQMTDQKPAGAQSSSFDITRFPTGIYFYSATLGYGSGRREKLKTDKFAVLH
jgi:hypothetical protein